MIIKAFVIILLLIIIGSMGSALFFLINDKGDSDRMVKALTIRISLSVIAFLLLLAGSFFGFVEPHAPF